MEVDYVKMDKFPTGKFFSYTGTESLSPKEALEALCELATTGDLKFTEKFNAWTREEAMRRYKSVIERAINKE